MSTPSPSCCAVRVGVGAHVDEVDDARRSRAPGPSAWPPRRPSRTGSCSDASAASKSARSRSSRLTWTMRGSPSSSARRHSRSVETSTPATPEISKSAPSTTLSAPSASPWNDGSPGVSMRFSRRPSHSACARVAEIDIERRFSSSSWSVTVVPSTTVPRRVVAPLSNSSDSTRDVFPDPRWPSTATLRIFPDSCGMNAPSDRRVLRGAIVPIPGHPPIWPIRTDIA